jgi:hypothetical protein
MHGSTHHVVRDHCLAPGRRSDSGLESRNYGRLFADLPALAVDESFLDDLGVSGGVCDDAGRGDKDDGESAAGWPVFGQLLAHDITADRSPVTHGSDVDPRNARSARANLECVYGGGPIGSPYLFERDDGAKLLVADGGHDVPRNAQGVALLGDPRNDVHRLVNQLHLAFLHAHNRIVDRLRDDGVAEADLFAEARRALVWHYQWVLLNEYLPVVVGAEMAERVRAEGASLQGVTEPVTIPLEFADAAFRCGHAQIRDTYRIRVDGPEVPLFPDLVGMRALGPDDAVEWPLLFDVLGHPPAQRAKRIDERLPASLIALPDVITGPVGDPAYRSLAVRDLRRAQITGLPSGEAVASVLGVRALDAEEVGPGGGGWDNGTNLWFYVLREADVMGGGDHLGPVGGRIVAEVVVGIVDADPESYRSVDPSWNPTLPAAGDRFSIVDLLLPSD